MAGLLDFLQSASNSVASNVTAPVDGIAWLLRKAGIPVPDAPVGGSDWAQNAGLTRPVQQSASSLAGESLGLIAPMLIAAKAPQVARGLLQGADNLMAPRTLNPETGAIVWHGSPHKFDKFDASKIGTGEGAQAYGHGLYLAESPEVAASYMRPAGRTATTIDGRNAIDAAYADRSIQKSVRYLQDHETPEQAIKWAIEDGKPEIASQIDELVKNGRLKITDPGNTYKVDLPDEHIAKMLDWDKPLSQQPHVLKALGRLGIPASPTLTGEELIRGSLLKGLSNYDGIVIRGEEALRSKGIPGIRYLDGGSRGAGAGTSNFVVFPGNEDLLSILERNGQALPKKFVYPQDKALATAQRNAALPIEQGGLGLGAENTAMERARALGFTDDAFHGSKSPEGIKNLVPGGEGGAIRHGDAYGTGVYTTTDAVGDASSYGSGGAVFPLKINRSNHLQIDAPNADDLQTLSKFAGDNMLPSDKARFSIGRDTRQFSDLQDARDFFGNQRENWKQFGDGMDRARPEAIANPDGTFAVQFTNFDAPVPITSGKDADTLLRAVGYDNVPSMGYSGHTLDRGAGRLWDVTPDTSKLRSRFAAFDPMRRNEADLLGRADPELLGLLSAGLLGYGGYNALSKP